MDYIAIGNGEWWVAEDYLKKNPDLAFLFGNNDTGKKAIINRAYSLLDEVITQTQQDLFKTAPQAIIDKLEPIRKMLGCAVTDEPHE